MGGQQSKTSRKYKDGEYDRVLAFKIACYMMCYSIFHWLEATLVGAGKADGRSQLSSASQCANEDLSGFTSEAPTQARGLLWIGASDVGKSLLLGRLKSLSTEGGLEHPFAESLPSIDSTRGFSISDVRHRTTCFRVWDLGGAPKIQRYWGAYLQNVHAVVFVINVQVQSLEPAFDVLYQFYKANPDALHLPLLVLGNNKINDGQGIDNEGTDLWTPSEVEKELLAHFGGAFENHVAVHFVCALPQGTKDYDSARLLRKRLWSAMDWLQAETI